MKELKVHFLHNGGFDKNGAFIEYPGELKQPDGRMKEYEPAHYLTFELVCEEISYNTRFGVIVESEKVRARNLNRSILAKGKIQPARWGSFSISFLGDSHCTQEIDVWIHEAEEFEQVYFSGARWDADLDTKGYQGFFLELHLNSVRFEHLLEGLRAENTRLQIQVRADHFPRFYAEWSPSISDGRVIKFLVDKNDIENLAEVPEDFWRAPDHQLEFTSNPKSPAVTITLARQLQKAGENNNAPEHDQEVSKEEVEIERPSLDSSKSIDYQPALYDISRRLNRNALWMSFWLALILLALVV